MAVFLRNRYDSVEFLRKFDSTNIGRDGNEVCISFDISNLENEDMRIYFPKCISTPPPELLQLVRLTCSRIAELDNLVQDSCENEWQHNDLHIDNYDLYLAHIEIEADIIRLEYYGTKVNTQWAAEFVPSAGTHWTKYNF